jgi:hypothetical protein
LADRQLDVRYFPYKVTVPAGTLRTNPATFQLKIEHGYAIDMELQIPSGHVGLTGWSINLAGTPLVPWGPPGNFVVAEDDRINFILGIEVDVQLTAVCYNEGIFDHSFYFRIALQLLGAPTLGNASQGRITPRSIT